jgi:hypothetical protein
MPNTAASCCNSSSGSAALPLRAKACSWMVASAPVSAPSAMNPATLSLAFMRASPAASINFHASIKPGTFQSVNRG